MPKGSYCSLCAAASEELRDEIVQLRQSGWGAVRLARWLNSEKGVPVTATQVDACVNRSRHFAGEKRAAGPDGRERLLTLLSSFGINPDDIGDVKAVRLSEWQGLTKNEDGEAEIHDLRGAQIVLAPSWESGPAWPVVDRAASLPVRPVKARARGRSGWRTAVILPDVQIGYRRDIETGTLDPFHDEKAMRVALAIVESCNPDLVVHLGDFLDFAPFGTYEQEAGFALTVQPAIDRGYRFLVEVREAAPRARQVLLEGNHDRRLQKAVVRNALAAFGIRRAERPGEWPVLSVPYLLRLEELGVEYVGGYPAGIFWLNERLACIHGHKVRSAGSTAAAVVDDERVSVIFGHTHRVELMHKTRRTFHGARASLAASPGCLCRIDGAVPSTKGSTDPMGRPVPTVENWTQGVGVVHYREGDGPFGLELVPIFDGTAVFRDRLIK